MRCIFTCIRGKVSLFKIFIFPHFCLVGFNWALVKTYRSCIISASIISKNDSQWIKRHYLILSSIAWNFDSMMDNLVVVRFCNLGPISETCTSNLFIKWNIFSLPLYNESPYWSHETSFVWISKSYKLDVFKISSI